MKGVAKYCRLFFLGLLLSLLSPVFSAAQGETTPLPEEPVLPVPPLSEIMKRWGPYDTILVPAIWYRNEVVNYKEMEMAWASKLTPDQLRKFIEEWTRLRNAVYVTYPYARIAGSTINHINAQLDSISGKKDRKRYIKSREKELKEQFGEPLTELSVYQGKILMKLINRQTGNNCYEIIKEYKGGLNARFYQTIAFFVGGNLKQEWDLSENRLDRDIESIVREIDASWYNNSYRR